MKKLSKNSIIDATVISDKQMKTVFGGSKPNLVNLPIGCTGDPCTGKKKGDPCCYQVNGSPMTGTCDSYMGEQLHCSDLA